MKIRLRALGMETDSITLEWSKKSMTSSGKDRHSRGKWTVLNSYEDGGRRYITAYQDVSTPGGIDSLTRRESQVAALAQLGHSNKVIAFELGLGHSTVRVLLSRAAFKFGVRTRVDLVDRIRSHRV
jgi:DNA-binding NarL/FixJ family response regulator